MEQNDYVTACLDRLIPELVGLTITGGAVNETGQYWGFTAAGKQDGKAVEKTVFVLADAEGNGPGFLEISDRDEPEPPAAAGACGCVREVSSEESAVVVETPAPRFAPGQVVATPGALAALEENNQSGAEYLGRHLSGDWGDLCKEDRQANEDALKEGLRLLSAYRLPDGTRLWIITEADRSSSTLLLPEDY